MIGENLMCDGYADRTGSSKSDKSEQHETEVSERQDEHGNWNWRRGSVKWKGSE
jgi:hypothetical protein